jgi:uracil phosphoribosyltransferase
MSKAATAELETGRVLLSRHPLVAHKVRLLRDTDTKTHEFRLLLKELAHLIGYEATNALPLKPDRKRKAPTGAEFQGSRIGSNVALVPVLRAGMGLVDGRCSVLCFQTYFGPSTWLQIH